MNSIVKKIIVGVIVVAIICMGVFIVIKATQSKDSTKDESTKKKTETSKVDLSDYVELKPEYLGGKLAQTLHEKIYPNDQKVTFDSSVAKYTLGDGAIEVGESDAHDGYQVWMFSKVDNFSIYGVQVGMTEAVAKEKLAEHGLEKSESDIYMITDNTYVRLNISDDGIVNWVCFNYYLGN